MANRMMRAKTVNEIDTLFSDFKGLPHKADFAFVLAAYALRKGRMVADQEEERSVWWNLYDEINGTALQATYRRRKVL